jgi:phosphoribosylaminoimidazole-succinocarboxamide synthase
MKVDMGFWERLSDKDYKKCKRVLKKAFREIKIDFVDPKYEFSRELSFGQKGIYIYDRMIY